MKRDMELIRKLVLTVEDLPTGFALNELQIPGYSREQIGYHSYLVVDEGLADGIKVTSLGDTGPMWRILNLTAAGHDFADAARDEGRWQKATAVVKGQAGTVTIDVMKQLLISLIKNTLGL